jgi:hypothetical protein
LVTIKQEVNIASTPHRGTTRNDTGAHPRDNTGLLLPATPPFYIRPLTEQLIQRLTQFSPLSTLSALRHIAAGRASQPSRSTGLYRASRANSAPNAASLVKLHTAEFTGELVTRLQLLAHRRGHIAIQTLSHSIITPYCKRTRVGTSTSTSTPFTISVRPFSGPHTYHKGVVIQSYGTLSLRIFYAMNFRF